MKPATKPESITGNPKVIGGGNRYGGPGQFSGEKQGEETAQGETCALSSSFKSVEMCLKFLAFCPVRLFLSPAIFDRARP